MSKIYLVKKRTMHETWCLVVDDDANVAGARALENDGVYPMPIGHPGKVVGVSVFDLRDSAPKEIADHVEKIMSREVQATPRKGEKGYTKGDGRGPAR